MTVVLIIIETAMILNYFKSLLSAVSQPFRGCGTHNNKMFWKNYSYLEAPVISEPETFNLDLDVFIVQYTVTCITLKN